MVEVGTTHDVEEAAAMLEPVLLADPVANNVPLSLLDRLRRWREPARFWWVAGTGDGPVTIVGLQSADGADGDVIVVVGDDPTGAEMLARAVADDDGGHELAGVRGEVRTAAAFAGAWAAERRAPASVAVLQRFYCVSRSGLEPVPRQPDGGMRQATADDLAVIEPWAIGFQREALGSGPIDTEALFAEMRRKVDQREVWLWETDRPVAMTANTAPVGAVSRVQHVYTPPERRNRGLAAALVAAQVTHLTAREVDRCVLFADLANPVSNALYQRLGFSPVSTWADFRLGSVDTAGPDA